MKRNVPIHNARVSLQQEKHSAPTPVVPPTEQLLFAPANIQAVELVRSAAVLCQDSILYWSVMACWMWSLPRVLVEDSLLGGFPYQQCLAVEEMARVDDVRNLNNEA